MATPHHHTFPTEMRSSGDGVRSALCSIAPGSSDPRLPPYCFTNLHAAACAELCGGHQERACPQPLQCSWRASESGQYGSIAHSTARSSAMAACSPSSPSSLPAHPPSCTAHPVPHTSSRDTSPTDVGAGLPLRTPAPPAIRGRGGTHAARVCQQGDPQLSTREISLQVSIASNASAPRWSRHWSRRVRYLSVSQQA